MGYRIAILIVESPILALWMGLALLEILAPVRLLRWRRRLSIGVRAGWEALGWRDPPTV
jgi:hypothetical protein